jgi:hypothetical protein
VIDNVILSDSMNKFYLPASATVRSDVATQVTNYGTTTTNHYPVFTQYSFTPPGSQPTQPPLVFTGVQQGNTALLKWTTTPENDTKLFEVQKTLTENCSCRSAWFQQRPTRIRIPIIPSLPR